MALLYVNAYQTLSLLYASPEVVVICLPNFHVCSDVISLHKPQVPAVHSPCRLGGVSGNLKGLNPTPVDP